MSTGLTIIKPLAITGAMLTSSNVPEPATGDTPDPAAYSSVTTYALGTRCHVASNHTIYESLQAGNLNHDPTLAANSTWWIVVGNTNRWRMFDQRNSSQTTNANSVDVTVTPGTICTSLALMNVRGASTVQVTMTDPLDGLVLDQTYSMQKPPSIADHWNYIFEPVVNRDALLVDLPSYRNASVRVVASSVGGAVVGIGVMAVGVAYTIGLGVNYGAKLGIQDYSVKTKNAFGDSQIIERPFSNSPSFELWLRKREVDAVHALLSSVRSKPCVWIGSSEYSSTFVYGIYKDFSITIQYYDYSVCNLMLEGLT